MANKAELEQIAKEIGAAGSDILEKFPEGVDLTINTGKDPKSTIIEIKEYPKQRARSDAGDGL